MDSRPQPTIRAAGTKDFRELAALSRTTFSETFSRHNSEEDMEAYLLENMTEAKLLEELRDAQNHFYLLVVDGRPAGYAKLHRGTLESRPAMELSRIYLLGSAQGIGAGQALLDFCIAETERLGYDLIWLGVWEHNEKAIRFYLKNGFLHTGEHVFQLGSDAQTDWIMQKKL